MEIPITNPHLSASLEDNSKVDESISQDGGLTINASGNATINSNSGNGRTQKGVSALFQILAVSIICDILICGLILFNNHEMHNLTIEQSAIQEAKAAERHAEVQKQIKKIQDSSSCAVEEAKEGTIWILRRDILNSIDFHESRCEITSKQYKRIKEQYEYYTSIGGNHDVKEKFDDFNTKIFGTNEIKMIK